MGSESDPRRRARVFADALAEQAASLVRAELEAVRADLDSRAMAIAQALTQSDTALLDTFIEDISAVALDEAETAARGEVEGTLASLAEAESRITELTRALEAARQEASVAAADADAQRLALELASEPSRAADSDETVRLMRVGAALHALDLSTRATELLDTLLDQMSRDFPTVAIFLVSSSAFKGWRGRGLGSVTDIGSLVIPRTLNSLLMQAESDRRAVTAFAPADSLLSLSGRGVTGGMAMPIIGSGRVIAVAYAESGEDASAASTRNGCAMAQLLGEYINRRLAGKQPLPGQKPDDEPASQPASAVRFEQTA